MSNSFGVGDHRRHPGSYDEERGSPATEPVHGNNPETPVRILKAWPWLAALQNQELLPEAKIVGDQQRLWLDSPAIAHSKQQSVDALPYF
jgi:hypothetical protein